MGGYNTGNVWYTPHQINQVRLPTMTLLMADASRRDISNRDHVDFRHERQANLVYVDGHAAAANFNVVPLYVGGLNQAFWVGGTYY